MTHATKELVLSALRNMKGDDLYRARMAFRGCTAAQMAEEYGESGRTRAEIIAGYEEHEAKINVAIAEIEAMMNEETT